MKRGVLDTAFIAAGAILSGHANAAEKSAVPPNIIFVFADQMRAHALGCYGNTIVPTPNIDAMASNGMTFDNAITPWHGVRTKRHTYVHLHGHGPWLLYDNERDPYQLENLVAIPEFAELVAALERRMQELMVEAGHPGDPQKVAQFMDSRRPK